MISIPIQSKEELTKTYKNQTIKNQRQRKKFSEQQ
jgi:hypothetical protein